MTRKHRDVVVLKKCKKIYEATHVVRKFKISVYMHYCPSMGDYGNNAVHKRFLTVKANLQLSLSFTALYRNTQLGNLN